MTPIGPVLWPALSDPAGLDALLRECLASPQALHRTGAFRGKPLTRIFATRHWVLKTTVQPLPDQAAGLEWLERRRERERQLGCYPPDKRWCLMPTAEGWYPASLCPRLQPLENRLVDASPQRVMAALQQVVALCLDVAARTGRALDEGLSNFATDGGGELYYLDDDDYPLNDYSALTASLATWVRRFVRCTPEQWMALGTFLGTRLRQGDPELPAQVLQGLQDQFLADARQRQALEHLCLGLRRSPPAVLPATRGMPARTLMVADLLGNALALEAVLSLAEREGIRSVWVLGNLVGGGPHPLDCVRRAREWGCVVVKGRQDDLVVGVGAEDDDPVLAWTRAQLDAEARDWLAARPLQHEGPDALACAQSFIGDPWRDCIYAATAADNLAWLATQERRWGFHGGSHRQGLFGQSPLGERFHWAVECELQAWPRALVCPGRAGRAAPGADFLIMDWRQQRLHFGQVGFSREQLAEDMRRAGFAPAGILRLAGATG